MVTRNGMCIRFKDTDIRSTGRNSIGVIGMNIDQGDEVVGMQMNTQGSQLLIVTENGMGKRTNIEDFHVQRRGGKGLKCYKITEKTGNVVGVKAVNSDHEIMLITNEGIIIQLRCDEISTYGRVTSGVKLINLKEGVVVAQIAKVRQTEKVTADEGGEVTDEGAEVVDEVSENESTEEAVDEVTEEIAENTENEETE